MPDGRANSRRQRQCGNTRELKRILLITVTTAMNATRPGVAERFLNFIHSDVIVPVGFSEALRAANRSPACRMPSGHPRPPRVAVNPRQHLHLCGVARYLSPVRRIRRDRIRRITGRACPIAIALWDTIFRYGSSPRRATNRCADPPAQVVQIYTANSATKALRACRATAARSASPPASRIRGTVWHPGSGWPSIGRSDVKSDLDSQLGSSGHLRRLDQRRDVAARPRREVDRELCSPSVAATFKALPALRTNPESDQRSGKCNVSAKRVPATAQGNCRPVWVDSDS